MQAINPIHIMSLVAEKSKLSVTGWVPNNTKAHMGTVKPPKSQCAIRDYKEAMLTASSDNSGCGTLKARKQRSTSPGRPVWSVVISTCLQGVTHISATMAHIVKRSARISSCRVKPEAWPVSPRKARQ